MMTSPDLRLTGNPREIEREANHQIRRDENFPKLRMQDTLGAKSKDWN